MFDTILVFDKKQKKTLIEQNLILGTVAQHSTCERRDCFAYCVPIDKEFIGSYVMLRTQVLVMRI